MNTKPKYFTYDFSNFDSLMLKLKDDHSNDTLNGISDELNRFFNDAKCVNILYNINTDKVFFGMCVMPSLLDSDIDNMIKGTDVKVRVQKYYVEIDSKLLQLNMSARELTACLLHEVGHVINDTSGTEKIKDAVAAYVSNKNEVLDQSNMNNDREIYRLGVALGLSKLNSLFNRDDDELIADSFVVACGYGDELSSAYKKIINSTGKLNKGVKNKLITLQWTLSLMLNMKASRIPALHSLKVSKKVEPSELIKNNISHTIDALYKYDIKSIHENLVDKISDYFDNVSYSDIRDIEDELYEYNIRVKNCEIEDDALIITRELNTRLSILDDLMMSKKLNDSNFKKCSDLKNRYLFIRKQLTDKKLYAGRTLSLFVDTPYIKGRPDLM